ncbi:MAG: DNA topoisomerase IV subunit A [Deltaproteobacteria bacterium]|nr:DNA topoisomerase IV subunit A [Deltaproteobacteria bacterium]
MTVVDTSLSKESRDRYLTYALSVVSERALPDVRDGLKPVQRRILYAMLQELNLKPSGSHKKSAAVVGQVLAHFHPHSDLACYEAIVRMAQDFSLRYPLVDGQGNFGSLDGDSAAAYRYTEVRLTEVALEVLGEINEETVDFIDNFDATIKEPLVLPSRLPNLLLNGASGIAVGMATSIPPHNLRDTVKALVELSKDADVSAQRLSTLIQGPDFPTGCRILNSRKELTEMYKTGRGTVRMRGEYDLENQKRGKRALIITSIPYAINKAQLVEKIAGLIIDKKVPQLVDVRDESTDKVRVVLELAPEADAEAAMAYLFKHTPLESNFNVNLTALVPTAGGAPCPQLLSLKEMLQYFLDFREQVVERRLIFEKKNLEDRLHLLEGFVKIFDKLDEAIRIVRQSSGRQDAAEKLQKRFKLSELQSFAVVDMRIYHLSKVNIEEIRRELKQKRARVKEITAILGDKKKIAGIVRKELEELAEKYGDRRRCKIVQEYIEIELDQSAYVVQEEVYAIITKDGWLKRIRQNNELGSTRLRDGDEILEALPLTTLDTVVFFTNCGFMYQLRVSEFPSSSGYGSPVQKLLKFRDGERIIACFGLKAESGAEAPQQLELLAQEGSQLVLLSKLGMGYSMKLDELEATKRSGKRVMKLKDGDELVVAANLGAKIAIFSARGFGLGLKRAEIPVRGRGAMGVKIMSIKGDDAVVGAVSFEGKAKFVFQTKAGQKRELESSDLPISHRGLKGRKVLERVEVLAVKRG